MYVDQSEMPEGYGPDEYDDTNDPAWPRQVAVLVLAAFWGAVAWAIFG